MRNGPYLLPERLTAATYYALIDEALPVLLEHLPLATREYMWFQHDRAPPHYGRRVRNLIDEIFIVGGSAEVNRYTGPRGPQM
jgi:hypothetical protein